MRVNKMNKNKITGTWQQTKGKVKEEAGHLIGNEKMESEEVTDQIKGKINKKVGKVKDIIKKGVDSNLRKKNAGG